MVEIEAPTEGVFAPPPQLTPFSTTPVYYQVKTRSFWYRQEAPKLFISFRQKKEPSYDALNEKVIFRS